MRAVLRQPLLWLALLLSIDLVVLSATGKLVYTRVADTPSYLTAADAGTLSEALSHYRSIGYPQFLRLVIGIGHWLRPVPMLQTLLYFGSICLFWWAVKRFSGSGWLAFAAALPLPWAGVMNLAAFIQPDFLSSVSVLAAVSFLLLLAGPPRVGWWVGLVVAVLCAYQLRPAAVFLVLFLPLLAVVLRALGGERRWRSLLAWGLGVAASTLLPLTLFCGLRWVTVGHFGLVSFGGVNLSGMAACFIGGDVVRELPKQHRRLSKSILRQRRKRGWVPMQEDSDTVEYFRQYSDNIWRITLPAVRKERRWIQRETAAGFGAPAAGDRPAMVEENAMLLSASRAVLRLRPGLYVKWVRTAIGYGLRQLLDDAWIVMPFLLIVCSAPIFWLRARAAGSARGLPGSRRKSALTGLWVLGLGYFVAYLILVCMVSFPFTRYFVSMTLFLPSALCAQLFELWRGILAPTASLHSEPAV